jgi:hypothetical protein
VRRLFFVLAALLALLYSAFVPQVFAAALILAFGVRLAYVLLASVFLRWRPPRPLLSGWIFVIALGLLLSVAATHERHVRSANASAVRQGVVAQATHVTPRDRCVGLLLDWWDKDGARQTPSWTKPKFRVFATGVCRRADDEDVLRDDGKIQPGALERVWYSS